MTPKSIRTEILNTLYQYRSDLYFEVATLRGEFLKKGLEIRDESLHNAIISLESQRHVEVAERFGVAPLNFTGIKITAAGITFVENSKPAKQKVLELASAKEVKLLPPRKRAPVKPYTIGSLVRFVQTLA